MYPPEVIESIAKALPAMRSHAQNGMPLEVVGLVLSDGAIVPLLNQARSDSRFEVSMAQMAEAFAVIDPEKHLVYSLYHSHPKGSLDLSPADQHNLRTHWTMGGMMIPWTVLNPETGEAKLWWLNYELNALQGYELPLVIYA